MVQERVFIALPDQRLKSKAIDKQIIKARPLIVPMALSELSTVLAVPVNVGTKNLGENRHRENAHKLFKALNP